VIKLSNIGNDPCGAVFTSGPFNGRPETLHLPVLFWGMWCGFPRRRPVFANKTGQRVARKLTSIVTSEGSWRGPHLERLGQDCSVCIRSFIEWEPMVHD
jgi:hypothetical protein